VYKDPGGRIRIALAFPNTYRVAMSNLGFQGIYGLLNAEPDIVCERTFLPEPDEMDLYRKTRTPLPAWESLRPVSDFHVLAFSVAYENDYPAVPTMLDLAGIPRSAAARDAGHPLVVLGGVCAAYNPEPLADFFDLVFIGEAEQSLPAFVDLLRDHGGERAGLLRRASTIRGLYVPGLYEESYARGRFRSKRPRSGAPERVRSGAPADLSGPGLRSVVVAPESEFGGMGLVEGMRGCPWSCRFCVVSRVYRPARFREPAILRSAVEELAPRFGRVGLIGPSLSDHRGAAELLSDPAIDFSISSIRAGRASRGLVRILAGKKVRSLSIAPEAGSRRLRRLAGKRLSEEEILETARLILASGVSRLRLYFMIGLPGESPDDVRAIVELVRRIREAESGGWIRLTVSPFVPKPFTPFQWMPVAREAVLRRRLRLIEKGLRPLRRTSLRHDGLRRTLVEAFLARADRRASAVVSGLADGLSLRRAARAAGIDLEDELHEPRPAGAPLPWDFIAGPVDRAALLREFRSVLRELGPGRREAGTDE